MVNCKTGRRGDKVARVNGKFLFSSPELAPLFAVFSFSGFPLFSTNQAKKISFCRGPDSSQVLTRVNRRLWGRKVLPADLRELIFGERFNQSLQAGPEECLGGFFASPQPNSIFLGRSYWQ